MLKEYQIKNIELLKTINKDVAFNFSEISIIKIPKRDNSINSRSVEDALMPFCKDTIKLMIEDLIVRGIITCSYKVTERGFFGFNWKDISYTLSVNQIDDVNDIHFGWLEQQLLYTIKHSRDKNLNKQISLFLDVVLGKLGIYTNLEDVIISKVITSNNNLWKNEYYKTHLGLVTRLKVTIDPKAEESMFEDLQKLCSGIIAARESSLDYKEFSKKLDRIIKKNLSNKVVENS